MRTSDLFLLALSALWRQKARTALTTLGVVLGACMLTFSLSIGQGVKEALHRQFRANDDLRRIQIYPGFGEQAGEAGIPPEAIAIKGEMSDERRARLRRQLVTHWHNTNTRRAPIPLNRAMLDRLAEIEFVERVVPNFYEQGRLQLAGKSVAVNVRPLTIENRAVPHQIVFGAMPPANDSRAVLVHEYLLYQLGVRDDAAVAAQVGKPIRLEINNHWQSPRQLLGLFGAQAETLTTEETQLLDKVMKLLPLGLDRLDLSPGEKVALRDLVKRRDTLVNPPKELAVAEEFTVAGVFRSLDPSEEKEMRFLDRTYYATDVLLPYQTGWQFTYRMPRRQEGGYDGATLTVDREDHVRPVVEEIKALGVNHYSAVEFVEHVMRDIKLMNYATTFIAGVALLVAGIGITNTMVTSVLERIQEIGIMKAVGAKDRHIQAMFLLEGAALGLIGGLLGLLLTWLVSLPGDGYARKIMAEQTQKSVEQALFVFPMWLVVSVPLFATITTTLAALYPARRAAKVDPIQALRHE